MWSWWRDMNEWKTATLGKIAKTTSGGTPDKKHSEYYNGSIPWVRSGELDKGVIRDTEIKITQDGLDNSSAKIFPAGTLLIALYGATIGKLAFLGIPAATNQAVCAIFQNDTVSLKYLYYYLLLKRPDLVKQGIGGAQPNISQAILKKLMIAYPVSASEQERIVARIEELFSQLDAGVETLKKTKAQLAVYRQAVITDAYNMGSDAPVVRLDEISQIMGGITKGRDLSNSDTIELPYLRVANVQNGYLDLSVIKMIQLRQDEKERYLLKRGDVLYTEGGDRDKLGRGTVWRDEIPDCVHQNHVFKARIDQERAVPEYVAYWSMSTQARNYFYQKGKQSVNLASINKTVLSALTIPLPIIEIQKEIINHIESRLSVCDSIEQTVDAALQQAEAMRQSILKDAFEGRL